MKIIKTVLAGLSLSLLSGSILAALTQEEIASLGTTLTPVGAERAGNADGSIPEWTGGLAQHVAPVNAQGFLSNPFKDEQPLFVITAENAGQYKDRLTLGMQAMFERYPQTYTMPVYASKRTAAFPEAIYQAAKLSAQNVSLINDGSGLEGFSASRAVPFPIPKNGHEVVWNHTTRYRGGNLIRESSNAFPQRNGDYTLVRMREQVASPAYMTDLDPEEAAKLLLVFKNTTTAPARLAGNVVLTHDTLDQVSEPRMAWQYNSGQRRIRRAPQIAYDSPGASSDGTRTTDDYDMFNGASDRYQWTLIGKREMYIPYNNYALASPDLKYSDILKAGHTDTQQARYELHRVWVVEADLIEGKRHIYAKRRFYVDEDSWTIVASEMYDGRGQLWRVGQAMMLQEYQANTPWYAFEASYDLISGRYGVYGMVNEESSWVRFGVPASAKEYTPAALRVGGVR